MLPVVIIKVLRAIEWNISALAPCFLPEFVGIACLWVALAHALVTVPVVVEWAGMWCAVASSVDFIPVESWKASNFHLYANTGGSVKSKVSLWVNKFDSVNNWAV